ncbi:MAG: hypothetical protein AB7N76_32235 [Planctomycetota bacterium]
MIRSLYVLGAAATATALAAALRPALVAPATPPPAATAAAVTAAPTSPALTTASSRAASSPALGAARALASAPPASAAVATSPSRALLSASSLASTALAPRPLTTLASARITASAAFLNTPALRLPREARERARRYLEACATDQGPLYPGRGLADTIAWMECGQRATPQDAFGPTPFPLVAQKVQEGIDHLAARSDDHPPDFDANDLLRLLYLYPPVPYVLATPTVAGSSALPASVSATSALATSAALRALLAAAPSAAVAAPSATTPSAGTSAGTGTGSARPARPITNRLPRDLGGKIQESLRTWKYWIDEGGPDDQVYWSENHVILYAAAEYLAGQLLPNAWFPNGGMSGRAHMAKARPRVLRWLDERLKFGFSEWNSPGYYEEDLKALFNLADFADDPLIRRRAAMVLDLLLFDLARLTHEGSFGVTSGRCYEKLNGGSRWKSSGWQQSVGELIEVLFGTRGRHVHAGAVGALYYATSSYEAPTVLLAIGQDRPARFVDRARVSLDFDEAAREWGIGTRGLDDVMFWWSKGAYMAKHTIAGTRELLRAYGVSRLRSGIQDALGFAYPAFEAASDGALYAAADAASPVTEGMCLTRANLYTFRCRGAMLSSAQDYRRGQIGPQQHVWQATLGMEAVVFTTLPGKREGDGPGYWTGSAALPSAVQHEGALIVAYDAPLITKLSEGLHRTHAWFPTAAFDETDRRRGSNLHGAWGVTSKGTWLFGRKGSGYVALYSNEGFEGGPTDWVAKGSWTNVFVCQVGDAAEFGSFQAFKDRVTAARIYIHYPSLLDSSPVYCGYDIPGGPRLELHYGGTPRLNGAPYPVHDFPRYDDPYAYQPWGDPALTIRHAGLELRHWRDPAAQDPRRDVRSGSGVR